MKKLLKQCTSFMFIIPTIIFYVSLLSHCWWSVLYVTAMQISPSGCKGVVHFKSNFSSVQKPNDQANSDSTKENSLEYMRKNAWGDIKWSPSCSGWYQILSFWSRLLEILIMNHYSCTTVCYKVSMEYVERMFIMSMRVFIFYFLMFFSFKPMVQVGLTHFYQMALTVSQITYWCFILHYFCVYITVWIQM